MCLDADAWDYEAKKWVLKNWADCIFRRGTIPYDERSYRAGVKVEKARSYSKGAWYAVAYAKGIKEYQKRVPKDFQDVGAFYGKSRGATPVATHVIEIGDWKRLSEIDRAEEWVGENERWIRDSESVEREMIKSGNEYQARAVKEGYKIIYGGRDLVKGILEDRILGCDPTDGE